MTMADLQRFKDAQRNDYEQALQEVKSGRKRTHWMWYIFPQIHGLGVTDFMSCHATAFTGCH